MINKVIFLMEGKADKRDYKRFGIELLQDNGFDAHITGNIGIESSGNNTKLGNYANDTLFINLVGYRPGTYQLYRAISRSHASYAVFMANAVPVVPLRHSIGHGRLTGRAITGRVFRKLPHQLWGIKPASLALAGGMNSISKSFPVDNKTRILWAHSLDYDLYLEEKGKPVKQRNIAVFLDEYYPHHPDPKALFGVDSIIDPHEYYSTLNRFFASIEEMMHLKVVISAHPKSEYGKHPDCFQGRKVVKGRTCELIRQSRVVMAHNSTSINLACLFHKPLMFLTSRGIEKGRQAPLIHTMAGWFGREPVDMEGGAYYGMGKELQVNRDVYDRYRQAYIKAKGSPNKQFWQIVADYLKEGGLN